MVSPVTPVVRKDILEVGSMLSAVSPVARKDILEFGSMLSASSSPQRHTGIWLYVICC